MIRLVSIHVPLLAFVGISILLFVWDTPLHYLKVMVDGATMMSYVVFVTLLFLATVFMPVTVMPIIPMSAAAMGPFTTGVLSIVGWTVGAMAAFLIARYLGRPFLERFISFEKLDSALLRLTPKTTFLTIILIRLTLPVDIMSYALGLTKTVPFVPYSLATLIGVSWFSFAFAYLGDAFFDRNYLLLEIVGLSSFIVFLGGWYMLSRYSKKK